MLLNNISTCKRKSNRWAPAHIWTANKFASGLSPCLKPGACALEVFGQKQRVAIARALVNMPQLVLADEPTAALDKQSGRDVVEIMQQLAKEQGSTIVLVTHDNRILDIADRIVQIEDGYLFTSDPLQQSAKSLKQSS